MATVEVVVNGEHLIQENVDVKDVDRVIEDLESGKIRMKSPRKKTSRKKESVDGIEVVDTVTLVEEPVVLEITSSPMVEGEVKKSRGRGKNNETRAKSNEIIKRMKEEEKTQKEIIKALIQELNITHANAWYYLNKVYRG